MLKNYYRAYDVEGKVHYGELFIEETMQVTLREKDERYFIRERFPTDWGLPYMYKTVEVMGSTVKAFSNLFCKNKMGIPIRIFEGDTVRWMGNNGTFVVSFEEDENAWKLKDVHGEVILYFTKARAKECIFVD